MTTEKKRSRAQSAISEYFSAAFASLKHRNFQFYCLGVIFSLTGSLLQEVVVAWLAYEKTGSSFVLGSILFSFQAPMIAMGVFGGWAADRFDRKRIVFITQVLALTVCLSWLTLSATGALAVWHMYVLSAIFGCIVAFEIPARFAMIPQLVDEGDIMNAFSLDSLLFYSARVMGPTLGALTLGAAGATMCFALNALTYVFELFTITPMKPAARAAHDQVSLREGFAGTWGNPKVRRLLTLVAVLTFCGCYIGLMPMFTAALHGTATVNGLLIAASEVGAMIGSLYLARKTANTAHAEKLKKHIGWAAISYAVFLTAFALSPSVWLSLALILPVGYSMTLVLMGAHVLMQNEIDDRMRGVASTVFWMYSYFGMLALGGPTLGYLAERIGVSTTISGAAALCVTAAVVYLRSAYRAVRPS